MAVVPACPVAAERYTRAIKVSLRHLTDAKWNRVLAVTERYRAVQNMFIRCIWLGMDLKYPTNKEIVESVYPGFEWSSGFPNYAWEVAKDTVISTKKAARELGVPASCPRIVNSVLFKTALASVKEFRGGRWNYAIQLSSMVKGETITLPFPSHRRFAEWFARGAQFQGGCIINPKERSACVFIRVPVVEMAEVRGVLALDSGKSKLFADQHGNFYGGGDDRAISWSEACDRVRRAKRGSRGKRRAIEARKQLMMKICKEVPWGQPINGSRWSILALEDLRGIKTGKGSRGKQNRKRMAPWVVCQAHDRLEQLAQENRVLVDHRPARYTSQHCPMCGRTASDNRRGEKFRCIECNYTDDADTVGARNIASCTCTQHEKLLGAGGQQCPIHTLGQLTSHGKDAESKPPPRPGGQKRPSDG